MQLLRKKGMLDSTRVLFLPVDDIFPNPDQPRRVFAQADLEELAKSIQALGLLQPLTSCSLPRCVPGAGTMSWWPGSGGCGRASWRG